MIRPVRPLAAVAVPGALALLVIACAPWTGRVRVGNGSWTFSVPTGDPGGWTGSFASSSGATTRSLVSGDGRRSEVTLGGRGASARVLGVTIAFDQIRAGAAILHLDGRTVSVRQGEQQDVRGVRVRCTAVTADDVTLVVTRL